MSTWVQLNTLRSLAAKYANAQRCRLRVVAIITTVVLIAPGALFAQSFTTPDSDTNTNVTNTETQSVLPQVFASITANRNEIYVSEQLNVVMEVLSPASAFNIRKQKLKISGADIFALEKNSVETTKDSTPYRLETTRYAIYFKQPGQYTIPALKVSATLPVSAGGESADSNPKISARSAAQAITVNPAPVPANQWLPASDLTVNAQWQTQDKPLNFIAGQPATRQYMFKVAGQFPAAIPQPDFIFPSGIRHYQSPPQFEKQSNRSGVQGSMVQTVSLIPEQPGEYTLPTLTINWWDIKLQRWKSASVAEETISVLPATHSGNNSSATPYRELTMFLAAVSTALAFCCIYLWRRLRHATRTPLPKTKTEKQAWNTLNKALKTENALQVRQALTEWHTAINHSAVRYRIDQLATDNADISASLQQLETSLFSNDGSRNEESRDVNFKQLRAQLKAVRHSLLLKNRDQYAPASRTTATAQIALYPSRITDRENAAHNRRR